MKNDQILQIKNVIRDVPDYPKEGIIFKDITTLLQDADHFGLAIDILYESVEGMSIDAIAAIESRGFIFGSVLAYKMGVGFIPIRKPGKLPAEVISEEYALEYGTDKIEIHKDAISEGENSGKYDDGTLIPPADWREKDTRAESVILKGFFVDIEKLFESI